MKMDQNGFEPRSPFDTLMKWSNQLIKHTIWLSVPIHILINRCVILSLHKYVKIDLCMYIKMDLCKCRKLDLCMYNYMKMDLCMHIQVSYLPVCMHIQTNMYVCIYKWRNMYRMRQTSKNLIYSTWIVSDRPLV
jgi:hypothetical protein